MSGLPSIVLNRLLLCRAWLEGRRAAKREIHRPRVIATATGNFPVYSHTFVYQEASAMADAGFDLAFVYATGDPRKLSAQFDNVGVSSRRLNANVTCGRWDYRFFRRRMPERVAAVTAEISAAAGLAEAELARHADFLQAFTFARMAALWRADYLHSYFFYERSLFTFVASRLLDLPRGVSCYADHVLHDYPLKVTGLQLRAAQVVVATSQRIGNELTACAGHPLPQMIVKPNGIDAQRPAFRDRATQDGRHAGRLVAVNRIDPKKGLTHLIAAIAILRGRGVRVELDILGTADRHDTAGRAVRAELRAMIARYALGPLVRLRGRQPSAIVHAELASAQLFVAPYVEMPSGDKDGIPTALLEAMAAGCASVVTDAGSIREVVDDGVEARIVPQRDPEALANAIAELLADPSLRARMAAAAIARVERQFDVRVTEPLLHARIHAALESARERRSAGPR